MPWGLSNIESILIWCFYKTGAEILCFQEVFSKEHRDVIQEVCSWKESQWNCWFPTTQTTFLSRWFSSFTSISGLCILTKKTLEVLQVPRFFPFPLSANVDRLVQKGYFHLVCKKDETLFNIITTHFQSDFTECGCRVRYQGERIQQEIELFRYAKNLSNVILVGDFNTSRFYHFQFVNSHREATHKDTRESLDHCLILPDSQITCDQAIYFQTVSLSDHIPVQFTLRFGKT
jgi:endonuclease/exonuclease/phosphatase family metal-dependent hydrolase